jgi:pantothenate synthetase
MSSRNAYLTPAERAQALSLSRALQAVRERFDSQAGAAPSELARLATGILAAMPDVSVEYVEVVDAETLLPPMSRDGPLLVAIAARVGKTRLIDNTILRRAR